MPHNTDSFCYLGDSPVENPEEDMFSRWQFSARIAETIAKRRDKSGIVIGIYGAWGEGKTTVINFIKNRLTDFENVVQVKFNPWIFPDENELLLSFFKSVADALERKIFTRREEIGEAINKYASLLAPAYRGAGDAVKTIGSALSSVDIEEYKARIENVILEERKQLVVFIDDIDRLDKSEIHAIFRIIKLSADFKQTSYVLAFDEQMVAAALSERYPSFQGATGSNFLEKIVQVPLNLPPPSKAALERICLTGIDEALNISRVNLEKNDVHEFWSSFFECISLRIKTPRMAKRYVNAILFSLPILKGEVNVVELLLVEAIRIFYPNLYTHIQANKELYLCTNLQSLALGQNNLEEEYELGRDKGYEGLDEKQKKAAKSLVEILFPRTGSIRYGDNWDLSWSKEQRISSEGYFDRYFLYSIPPEDMSDTALNSFIESLSDIEPNEAVGRLSKLLKNKEETGIRKLRSLEDVFNERQSIVLSLTMAAIGGKLPNPETLSFYMTPFVQSAILIAHLLRNINRSVRLEIGRTIIKTSTPVYYSFECIRWINSGDDTEDKDRLFNLNEEKELKNLLVEKIKKEAEQEAIYKRYPAQASSLLDMWAWATSKEETSTYLKTLVEEDPDNATQLLMTYVPTAWSMDTGIPHKSDFKRDHYNALASVVDPDIINDAISSQYKKIKTPTSYPHVYNKDEDIQSTVLRQFLFIHAAAKKEEVTKEAEQGDD